MGCGSGMSCWRRLKEWHEAGVWERLTEFFWTTSERPTRSLGACLTRFGFHPGQKGGAKPERIRNRSCEPPAEVPGGLEHGR